MTCTPVPGTPLAVDQGPDGWGIAWQTPAGRFVQTRPVAVDLAPEDCGAGPAAARPGERPGQGYTDVDVSDGMLVGHGRVSLGAGADLVVRDHWSVAGGELRVRRSARVRGDGRSPFACRLTMRREGQADGWAEVAPFIPGVAYGDAPQVAPGALGGVAARRAGVRAVLVREDRAAAPLVLARYPDGAWLAVLHADPDGGTVAGDGSEPDGGDVLVDERLRYAALGGVATDDGLELGLWFPGLEGEYTYSSGGLPLGQPRRWRPRYHPARDGLRQEWQLALRAGNGAPGPAGAVPAW